MKTWIPFLEAKFKKVCVEWYALPVIPALGRQRKGDLWAHQPSLLELKANTEYRLEESEAVDGHKKAVFSRSGNTHVDTVM